MVLEQADCLLSTACIRDCKVSLNSWNCILEVSVIDLDHFMLACRVDKNSFIFSCALNQNEC